MNENKMHNHRWSGWPGAHCMKCGSDDYMEIAIGSNWFDPFTDTWDTEEHKLNAEKHKHCSISDLEWYNHLVKIKGKKEADLYFPGGIPIE